MPVTFGTVEIVPQAPSLAPAANPAGTDASAPKPTAIDPRDLASALHRLADREARVRAH